MKLGTALRDPWVWGQGLLFFAVGTLPLLRQSLPPDSLGARVLRLAELPWRLGAVVPLVPGLIMLVWGAVTLGKNLTPATQPLPEGELVEHGAYGVVRHPIYLGVILCLWSLGWWLTSPRIGLVVAVVCYLYFDRKAAVEERRMTARFPGYEALRRRVPKLLPFPRR